MRRIQKHLTYASVISTPRLFLLSGGRKALKRLARREVGAFSLAGVVFLLATAVALAMTGDLSQPAGTAGCISETGAGPCADGHGLNAPDSVAVSADGKSVYAASQTSNAVVLLNRNTTTGAITQPAGTAGCVSETGAGPCADGHGLSDTYGVAVSADGKSVYAVSQSGDAVVRFNRNKTTGAITEPAGTAGCISETGAGPCADGRALSSVDAVTVSPDGKSVYATSLGGVARFNRNTTTGAITQPAGTTGCISETGAGSCADGHALANGADSVAVSANGASVYVASYPNNAVLRLTRNTTTGAITQPAGTAGCISQTGSGPCADGHALLGAVWVAPSADGKSVYVSSAAGNSVARLNRNTTTGAITQPAGTAGCISQTGSGPCADGHALVDPVWVAASADGKSVYVASLQSDAVARFNRNTTTGAITQPAGTTGCISETGAGSCADGHGLMGPFSVAVSADGKSAYVASYDGKAVARLNRAP
jgi:DNA-binding beta-propeller fold protein YncE